MEVYRTKRLILEKAVLNDAPFFLELLSSPNWKQYIGDRGISTQLEAVNYISLSLIGSYKKNGFGLYKMSLLESGVPVGICGIVKREGLPHPDLGFAILPKYEGKGYTSEAATATLAYAKSLNIKTILAITTEDNLGSQKVLEKAGMEKVAPVKMGKPEQDFLCYRQLY